MGNNKLKKSIVYFLIFSIGFVSGSGFCFYLFNKSFRTAQNQKTQIELSAEKLAIQFTDNEKIANELYLNKIVEIEGEIISIDGKSICIGVAQNIVCCNLLDAESEKINTLKIGENIKIKGICIGLGLFEVQLNKAVIAE